MKIKGLILGCMVLCLHIETPSQTQKGYKWFESGIEKQKQKDLNGAIVDFSKAIEMKPNFAEAYAYRAEAKRMADDYQGAIADFSKAIALKPDYSFAYYNRGLTKVVLKDYQGALADYKRAATHKIDRNNKLLQRP